MISRLIYVLTFYACALCMAACSNDESDETQLPGGTPFVAPEEATLDANQQNGGIAAADSISVYYLDFDKNTLSVLLVKKNKQTGETAPLMKAGDISHLCVRGDYLYFMSSSSDTENYTLWRMACGNGNVPQPLFSGDGIRSVSFLKSGIYVMFFNNELHWMDYEGKNDVRLDWKCQNAPAIECDGYVYYVNERSELHRCKVGEEVSQLIFQLTQPDGIRNSLICQGRIYLTYSHYAENGETTTKLCSMKLDGTDMQELFSLPPSELNFNVWGDKIFFSLIDRSESGWMEDGLYVYSPGDKQPALLLRGEFDGICLPEYNCLVLGKKNEESVLMPVFHTDFSGMEYK